MKLVRPADIDDAVLVASTVAEDEPQYAAGTTYGLGAIVRGSGATAHSLFESLQAGNLGHPLTDLAWWLPIGPTNRWAALDGSPQSQTVQADQISYTFEIPGIVDTIGVQNVSAASVRVIGTHPVDGLIFDLTQDLTSDAGIIDAWTYCFEPITRRRAFTFTDLSPYDGLQVEVILEDAGAQAAVGELILGQAHEIGGTQWGFALGIQDYSRKEADDFGNYVVVERAFAKRATFPVVVDGAAIDAVYDLLTDYRATPVLWVGDEAFGASAVFGFFKDLSLEVAFETLALLNLEIEGIA